MAVNLSPVGNDAPFILSTGVAASGYKLFTYSAGSSTKLNTYTDNTGNTANANPIILNSSGYPASAGNVIEIWLTGGSGYKFVLAPSTDTDPPASPIWSRDNIMGINDVTATASEWITGPTPTYISATQLSLVGDQTATFTVGRRLKTTNTAGTIYSTITVSAYTSLTTLTVVNDSGTLDSGLSAVSYGLISSTNTSAPVETDAAFRVSNSVDPTKLIKFSAGSITTATTRTYTFQDSSDTLVGRATTDTLTNKTLTDALANTQTVSNNSTKVATTAYADRVGWTVLAAVSASGTSVDFTIPTTATGVIVSFSALSTNGTSAIQVQLGDAGGVETTGYRTGGGGSAGISSTAGFQLQSAATAANAVDGALHLSQIDPSTFKWSAIGSIADQNNNAWFCSGSKATSQATTTVRVTMVNGSDAFDAGVIGLMYHS